jgi:hypothetical protein
MLTMLVCKTIPQTHNQSLAQSAQTGITSTKDMAVVSSFQGIGKTFVLIEHEELGPLLKECSRWAPLLEIEATQVIPLDEATKVLAG